MVTRKDYDVIIVGAGPSGTSAARILAEYGRNVLIVERETFPRYRVGESLIPYCWFPLDRLGMIDKLKASQFVKKYSVQFVGMTGNQSTPFYFSKHTDHDCAQTWQVVRSEFDQMLLDHAVEAGAEVMMPCNARELIREDGRVVGVKAVDGSGMEYAFRAKCVIDASGRDLFSVKRESWKVQDPDLKKMALWTYYKGAKRDSGIDEGATTVAYLPEKGWFWYIPLHDDMVSVGIVCEKDYMYRDGKDLEQIFNREVAIQPWIADHLSTGERVGEFRVTADYTYRSEFCAEDGLLLCGDAFSFIDPVFSSGVFLALHGGVMAGDHIECALRGGEVNAEHFEEYSKQICGAIEAMRKLVFAFYDESFSFGDLLKKHPELRPDLTDCLIGHLTKDFRALFDAVSEFGVLPEPLQHGGVKPEAVS